MLLQHLTVYNNYPDGRGYPVPLSDSALYTVLNPLGSVNQLAPGQCLLFRTNMTNGSAALPDCYVIGELMVDANVAFWAAAFQLDSVSDGIRRECPAAILAQTTVCIMPR
jgi:hypothetical protein